MGWSSLGRSEPEEGDGQAFIPKCGILIPVDGSMDSTINIRGREDYVVHYPGEAEREEDPFEDESDASEQDVDDERGADI